MTAKSLTVNNIFSRTHEILTIFKFVWLSNCASLALGVGSLTTGFFRRFFQQFAMLLLGSLSQNGLIVREPNAQVIA